MRDCYLVIDVTGSRTLPADNKPEPNPSTLLSLSRRVERLMVSHRDPESFFEERSEIAQALRRMAREARQ